jgi:hypothetical protein
MRAGVGSSAPRNSAVTVPGDGWLNLTYSLRLYDQRISFRQRAILGVGLPFFTGWTLARTLFCPAGTTVDDGVVYQGPRPGTAIRHLVKTYVAARLGSKLDPAIRWDESIMYTAHEMFQGRVAEFQCWERPLGWIEVLKSSSKTMGLLLILLQHNTQSQTSNLNLLITQSLPLLFYFQSNISILSAT